MPPEPLQIIEFAGFFGQDVDDVVAVVGQHPLGVVVSFHALRPLATFRELLADRIRYGLYLAGIGPGTEDEVVGE